MKKSLKIILPTTFLLLIVFAQPLYRYFTKDKANDILTGTVTKAPTFSNLLALSSSSYVNESGNWDFEVDNVSIYIGDDTSGLADLYDPFIEVGDTVKVKYITTDEHEYSIVDCNRC